MLIIFKGGSDTPQACSLATKKSWQIQPSAFDKSVKSAPKTLLLSFIYRPMKSVLHRKATIMKTIMKFWKILSKLFDSCIFVKFFGKIQLFKKI